MSLQLDAIALAGGLDESSGMTQPRPGRLLGVENFEIVFGQPGYRRINGYERFDGQASPSEARYWTMPFYDGATEIVAGDAIDGPDGSALVLIVTVSSGAWLSGDAVGTIVMAALTGDFDQNDSITVSAAERAKAGVAGTGPIYLTDVIDTFTASNGTDPTSRDIDAYGGIDGFKRWRLNYQPGEIQSDALVGGGDWIADSAQVVNIYLEDDTFTSYPLPLPWMLLIDGLTIASGAYSGLPEYYFKSYGTDGETLLQFFRHSSGSSTVDFVYRVDNGTTSFDNYTENGGLGHSIGSLGPHKIGVFFEADGVSVILNGAVLYTSTGGDAVYSDFGHAEMELDGSLTDNTILDNIKPVLVSVADLTAAIALTV